AIFAAGCFWGVQWYFDQVPGVTQTIAGYSGGSTENPTYEDVLSHKTGHAEAVWIEYDADTVSFETLVRQFFRMHDPTQLNRQGPDVGENYRSAIFYTTDEQKEIAERVRDELQPKFDGRIVTEITLAGPFYRAEEYHQKYTEKTGRGACHVAYAPVG
ncbi:MAG TPA: peptide-methionine (S)-S-oxide reductase MsrA, partial [Candidatus Saccharimonadales bacterium]